MLGAGKHVLTYVFGAFELDVRSGELRKLGVRIKLQDQPRQILLFLLEHPGEVFTREQIQQQLWPGDTFVDFDNAINSAVRKLRDALGDTADNPRFIETLARRGYRLMVPVTERSEPAAVGEAAPTVIPTRRTWPIIAAAIVAVGLVTALATWRWQWSSPTSSAELRVSSLTANTGVEIQPSFSPDGTRVAYIWGDEAGRNFTAFIKLIGPGNPVPIAKGSGWDLSPAWSPDGRWIALLRDSGRENAVLLVPATGGQPQVLARVSKAPPGTSVCTPIRFGAVCGITFYGSLLTWSPDGKFLFTSGLPGPDSSPGLVRISFETGEQQIVTSPPKGSAGDVGPAISNDGRALGFARLGNLPNGDIYVVSLSSAGPPVGEPRRLTFDGADLSAPAWTPDGRELIFSSNRGGRRELWRVSASGSGKPIRLAVMGENPSDVAISPQGRRLIFGRAAVLGSLWKVPIATGKEGEPVRVMATTTRVLFPHYSPDGKRVAFQAARSGVFEIWLCDTDGSNSVQLTNFGKGVSGSPRWSPDGRTIAFDSNETGNWQIYVIGSEGGRPVRLTTSPATGAIPNWSRDGHWIYFCSSRTGRNEIWKIHPDGTSEKQVTTTGGTAAVESVDGKFLYFTEADSYSTNMARIPTGGGPKSKVMEGVSGRLFTVTERGIYIPVASSPNELRFFNFETNSTRVVATLGDWPYATVSSDGSWAIYTRNAHSGSNLMLVENFH